MLKIVGGLGPELGRFQERCKSGSHSGGRGGSWSPWVIVCIPELALELPFLVLILKICVRNSSVLYNFSPAGWGLCHKNEPWFGLICDRLVEVSP